MAYRSASGTSAGANATRVYGEHAIRGLDDMEGAERNAYADRQSMDAAMRNGARYSAGAPATSRFQAGGHGAAGAGAGAGAGSVDALGQFLSQPVPALSQAARALPHASLENLGGFKVRDLFSAHAARVQLPRAQVVKEAHSQLYVPRQTKLLQQADFVEFNAAAVAYASTMANTTANARAKAAARAAKLGEAGAGGGGAAASIGAGGGAAAVVAAATASAVSGSDPSVARPIPLIPQTHDPYELARAQATEAYLQEIWNDNRAKQAADERLRKHISKLVGEWSHKLARFEEEVARRQEDTYYAKFRRNEQARLLAKSMPAEVFRQREDGEGLTIEEEKRVDAGLDGAGSSGSTGSLSSQRAAMLRAHRQLHEDMSTHYKHEAYSTAVVGKDTHADPWTSGTEPGMSLDAKAIRAGKESAKRNKAMLDHQMAHSICASTLAAPQGPTTLQALLAREGTAAYGSGVGADTTTPLSFSSFRPVTSPATRVGQSANGADDPLVRPMSTGKLLPALLGGHGHAPAGPPPGFSVRQPRPSPFAGVPGHGHPSNAGSNPFEAAHVFPSRALAQTAGIALPERGEQGLVPHLSRRADMLQVERVKDRLAAARIAVPRGTIERALVAPEIRLGAEQAQTDLPAPFFSLPDNPLGAEKKKKKSKKDKKGSNKK